MARAGSVRRGKEPPILEVGEAGLDRGPCKGEDAVGVLLAWSELVGAGCVEAGDDHGVAYVARP